MDNKLKTATVIKTGRVVQVYKLSRGPWCDFADSKTEYQHNELKFH